MNPRQPRTWAQHWDRGPLELADRFNALDPEGAVPILESVGLCPSGGSVNHHSLENRVFSYTVEGADRKVLKVYRPGRWTPEALQEELDFIDELLVEGVAVVRPMELAGGNRLGVWEGMYYAIFDFVDGVEDRVDPFSVEELQGLGRLAARIHNVGARRPALHRMPLEPLGMGSENLAILEAGEMVPRDFIHRYSDVANAIIELAVSAFDGVPLLRVHGDLGNWNLLWTGATPVVMDFDDFAMAPAVQDLATLHAGLITPWGDPRQDRSLVDRCLVHFKEGYRELRDLPEEHTRPLKHLRGLRTIWFDAWIQSRLHDSHFVEQMKDEFEHSAWLKRVEGLERFLVELRN